VGVAPVTTHASAREEVLARVRTALADPPAPPPVARTYRTTGSADGALELLAARLADYRAVVHRTDEAGLPAVLASALGGAARRTVLPPGFPAGWLEQVEGERLVDDGALSPQQLDEVDSVVTTCAVAIAVTGTVVLDGQAGQGRRALSLVPDHHVLVVRADQVVPTVPEALARLDPARPMTWISGPSATSDIELQRVEGVHGPRRLEVVLVAPAPAPGRDGAGAAQR